MYTFQEILRQLSFFWEKQGCIIHQGYDLEVGAGTFNPATFLRCLGPEPYKAAYIEPSRRPSDGRFGANPNRLQHYFQYQVILKPSPENIQDLYLQSLEAIGFKLDEHDIRFVHDDWESPTLAAWGLGWEVWMDGMEVTQFTYFQSVGGVPLKPITGEITYGIERLAMYLQKVNSIFDLKWNEDLSYGDIYHRNEIEWSHYNFEKASIEMWQRHFEDYEREAKKLINQNFPLPAYDFVMKASHAFNILDARGAISVTERTGYIARVRDLARLIAESYIKSREVQKFPLLQAFNRKKREGEKPLHAGPLNAELLNADPAKSEDFILEIGSEELPATFVPIGCQNLEKAVRQLLEKENLPFKGIKSYGTPRRLAVYVEGLAFGKKSQTVEKRGPAIAQAFDSQGNLQPAGEGFFRSLNIPSINLSALKANTQPSIFIQSVKGVDYLFARVEIPGSSTAKILADHLPALITGLEFPKKMRWGSSEITYARPLRWILALYGKHVIPFIVGDILSNRHSHGHRQLCNTAFDVDQAQQYISRLKEHYVMADMQDREQKIMEQLDAIEKSQNLEIICRNKVIPQVLNLVEWPQVTHAPFNESFLKVPKEVLISEMVEHQKYFPTADANGCLKNIFIITADTNPSDQIREGNQRVISARLSDGMFLYEQGLKTSFDEFNEKLKHVTFQKVLGTVYEKVKRIAAHAETIQKTLNIGALEKVRRAAMLCKADLASEMVYEFPDLQGTIGKYYALASGELPEVAQAIDEHWMPRGENAPLPETPTGVIVSIADKIDNLIGCFCADLKPTSSSDPYALRRQTLGIIKMLINGKYNLPLRDVLQECMGHFPPGLIKDKTGLLSEIEAFIINRVKTVFQDYGLRKDEIEAALALGFTDIYDAFCKVQSLHQFREKNASEFSSLYEVYKRAKGQLNGQSQSPFSKTLLKENAEIALNQNLDQIQVQFDQTLTSRDYDQAYRLIATVQPSLAQLFDQVKILADDDSIRNNRIALLRRVFTLFDRLLDFGKIGEK